jgi:hypothetical protein
VAESPRAHGHLWVNKSLSSQNDVDIKTGYFIYFLGAVFDGRLDGYFRGKCKSHVRKKKGSRKSAIVEKIFFHGISASSG